MIDLKSLEIVNKIYIDRTRRDKIKAEYNLNRKELSHIERSTIREILLNIKSASEATDTTQKA